ncbi:MAG TPA: hypothetical protein VK603_24095 [Candidatus Saccharimonadales bacterium]|nr:hypothetical protein [Candidatus Saccharimonadales bacterium]
MTGYDPSKSHGVTHAKRYKISFKDARIARRHSVDNDVSVNDMQKLIGRTKWLVAARNRAGSVFFVKRDQFWGDFRGLSASPGGTLRTRRGATRRCPEQPNHDAQPSDVLAAPKYSATLCYKLVVVENHDLRSSKKNSHNLTIR